MSTPPTNLSQTDGGPFYKEATELASKTFKRWAQLSLIDRVDCAWGDIVLRRIVDLKKGSVFEVVVNPKTDDPPQAFPVEAKVVGDAISNGESGLVAALQSSPAALKSVARWVPDVKAKLDALDIARSAPAPRSSPRGRGGPRV